ncbi:hypothetical protein F4778DRAFT_560477 [Xylariomycetidae sp. FL2044]|nr:hypothetical protein F4778DRAFT_560477 [Xylariomycetidae sp. FL2044]
MDRLLWQRAIRTRATRQAITFPQLLVATRQQCTRHASSAPRIAQTSFWKSLIPKPLRKRSEQPEEWRMPEKPKSKEWNPATFYIVIFLFIGSMSIQMIILKKEFSTFMRQSDVRIGLLREVVEKLQRGEEVNVEKALGTGDAQKEQEWAEVLREIERDDTLKNAGKKIEKTKPPTPKSTDIDDSKPKVTSETTEQPKPKTGGYTSFF